MFSRTQTAKSSVVRCLFKARSQHFNSPRNFLRPISSFRSSNPYLKPRMSETKDSQSSSLNGAASSDAVSAKTKLFKPIVWIDCEMTGLDHVNDHIIEICCIITDGNLNIIDEEGYESVVHYGADVMDKMDEWCTDHHGSSGLTDKVLASLKTRKQVEAELLDYIKKYIPDERKGILAGNSVHMDRLFMLREFPKVTQHLFYRIIDVSTIMEVCFRHNAPLASVFPKKKAAHTAKSDILESIAQLRWYQNNYLKDSDETQAFVEKRDKELEAERAADAATAAASTAESLKTAVKDAAKTIAKQPKKKLAEIASSNCEKGKSSNNEPCKKQRLK
ncbi:LAMI_0G16886g1_1 [Lachancea mirantina]|uniref:LAMI_0G16886g1_1 n=1 Tax=Lachancea mirantina TaxID=1230905 RepID=A0A1G4KCN6_9SACH|nr:LAMI_0G16886g1_1 [Lachancea mirantina]